MTQPMHVLFQGVAAHIAHAAVPYLAPGGSLMARGYGQKGSSVLTVDQQQQVFRHQAAIAELLRHFWSCFPARTAQLEVKVIFSPYYVGPSLRANQILVLVWGGDD